MALHTSLGTYLQVLFSPDAFFESRTPREGGAGRVVVAVACLHPVVFLASLVAGAVLVSLGRGRFGVVELLVGLDSRTVGYAVALALLVVVNWLLVGAVLHVAVKLLHGEGTFADTLFVVGWSSPAALTTVVIAGAAFVVTVAGSDVVMTLDGWTQAAAPGVRLAGVFGALLALLWQAAIWPAGLQRVHDVERETATRAAAVTVLLGVVALLVGP